MPSFTTLKRAASYSVGFYSWKISVRGNFNWV